MLRDPIFGSISLSVYMSLVAEGKSLLGLLKPTTKIP